MGIVMLLALGSKWPLGGVCVCVCVCVCERERERERERESRCIDKAGDRNLNSQ